MASMNDIKARMKSVESTMQITKAMELVATSKLRRAKENVERTRPFYRILRDAIDAISASAMETELPWFTNGAGGRTLYIVFAGDRGLAGGYNSNIFKLTEELRGDGEFTVLPIGKKALEYARHRNYDIYSESFEYAQDAGVGSLMTLGRLVAEDFASGKFDKVVCVYTEFVSMMTQRCKSEVLLPLERHSDDASTEMESDCDGEEMLLEIIPSYIGGVLYSALCESLASESGARRAAMNSANKNASEMIDNLMLTYNRARQAVITQEITEIVSGAEAL